MIMQDNYEPLFPQSGTVQQKLLRIMARRRVSSTHLLIFQCWYLAIAIVNCIFNDLVLAIITHHVICVYKLLAISCNESYCSSNECIAQVCSNCYIQYPPLPLHIMQEYVCKTCEGEGHVRQKMQRAIWVKEFMSTLRLWEKVANEYSHYIIFC